MKNKRILRKFECCWCNHKFEKMIVYNPSSKKGCVASTVVCPGCGHTIPASDKQLTGNLVGRKHIHKR